MRIIVNRREAVVSGTFRRRFGRAKDECKSEGCGEGAGDDGNDISLHRGRYVNARHK